MKAKIIFAILIISLLFSACNSVEKKSDIKRTQTEVISHTFKSNDGSTLAVEFRNTEEIARIKWQNLTLELKDNRPASGMWYKNNEFELRGKGNEITLSKNGKIVFQSTP